MTIRTLLLMRSLLSMRMLGLAVVMLGLVGKLGR